MSPGGMDDDAGRHLASHSAMRSALHTSFAVMNLHRQPTTPSTDPASPHIQPLVGCQIGDGPQPG